MIQYIVGQKGDPNLWKLHETAKSQPSAQSLQARCDACRRFAVVALIGTLGPTPQLSGFGSENGLGFSGLGIKGLGFRFKGFWGL